MGHHMCVLLACAWVLWGVHEIAEKLVPIEGFETKDGCELALKGIKEGKAYFGLKCLPDTIDPRTPKR